MPKKLNKGGKEQEYIPAGNGDESGEYADDSGSNKHFTSFKQPEQTGTETTEAIGTPTEKPISEVQNTKNEEPSVDERKIENGKTIFNELSSKSKLEIAKSLMKYRDGNRKFDKKTFLFEIKYFGGTYGNLLGYSDEQLSDMIDYVNSTRFEKNENDYRYYKKGKDWYRTSYGSYFDDLGIKTYTESERNELEQKVHEKAITNSKAQQEIIDSLKKRGLNAVISFKGLTDENSKKVGEAINKTLDDFDELKSHLVSFGTEKGLVETVKEEYENHIKTPEYKIKLENYKAKVREWNKGQVITDEKATEMYKALWLRENTHVSNANFWGCCGSTGGGKSWVQLKNTRYKNYQEENERSIERYGYPNNIGASFESTAYHELGHAICNMVMGASIMGTYGDTKTIYKIQEVRKKYGKPISHYGRNDIPEYIAECFASHYTYGDNEQANEVFNIIMNKYKEKFGK